MCSYSIPCVFLCVCVCVHVCVCVCLFVSDRGSMLMSAPLCGGLCLCACALHPYLCLCVCGERLHGMVPLQCSSTSLHQGGVLWCSFQKFKFKSH